MDVTSHFSTVFRCFRMFGIQAPKSQSDLFHFCLSITLSFVIVVTVVSQHFQPLYRSDGSGFATDILKFITSYSTITCLSIETIWLKKVYLDSMLAKIDEVTALLRELGIDTHVDLKQLSAVFSKRFVTAQTCFFAAIVLELIEGRLSVFVIFIFKLPCLMINLKVWQAILHIWIHQYMLLTLRDVLRQLNTNLEYDIVLRNRRYRAFLTGRFKKLMRLYGLIYDYTDLFNQYFGYSFYVIMQSNVMQTLPFFYWTIRDLYKFELSLYHYALAITTEQLTMLFLIITSSLIGKDEYFAATIPGLVHKLKLDLSMLDDDGLNVALESFSQQVLHETILFSAGGFYPINMKIIIMTLTTITQNLVIFVQGMAND